MKYLILSILFFLTALPVFASSCPFGLINDPFPGQCALYIDENQDGFCDNSQDIPDLAGSINTGFTTKYYVWQIVLGFIIFELMGISLIQYNKLKQVLWRKINNYGLLISFIVVFFTSLIILANLAAIIKAANLRLIIWLHAESGLIMILFSVEHLIRRWRYFIKKL